jgi:hypothetical protein
MHHVASFAVLVLLALPTTAQAQSIVANDPTLGPGEARDVAWHFLAEGPLAPFPDLSREELDAAVYTPGLGILAVLGQGLETKSVGPGISIIRGAGFGVAMDRLGVVVAYWTCEGCLELAGLEEYAPQDPVHTCSRVTIWDEPRRSPAQVSAAAQHFMHFRLSRITAGSFLLPTSEVSLDAERVVRCSFEGGGCRMVLDTRTLLPTAVARPRRPCRGSAWCRGPGGSTPPWSECWCRPEPSAAELQAEVEPR